MNTNKFPDFPALVSEMHDKGVKVTLWYGKSLVAWIFAMKIYLFILMPVYV